MPPTSDPISLLHWIRISIRIQTMAVISLPPWSRYDDVDTRSRSPSRSETPRNPPLVNGDLFSFWFSGDEKHELVPLIS